MPLRLPDHPDLDQLRRLARELLRAAESGDPDAASRIDAVNAGRSLSAAQLALAREYGYPSWPNLRADVERIRVIASGDADALRSLIAAEAGLATEPPPVRPTTITARAYDAGGGR